MTNARRAAFAAMIMTGALVLAACGGGSGGDSGGGGNLSGAVRIDGSSTVYPLTALAAEDFMAANPGVQVTVASSGTGGGFEKFCRGETDANDASRKIKDEEKAACEAAGIAYGELQVAVDALTVVVNKENTWATCLTVEELAKIWAPESTVKNWSEVRAGFPDVPLALFGPGTDSGTFDYFTASVNGEEGASRTDYTPTEDDNVTVQGVSGSPGGLGYFGFTYFEENADKLNAVAVDSGAGCVAPSVETAQDGSYTPLSRPLFIYPSVAAVKQPQVKAFFDYYVANDASIAEGALFIPLNETQKAALQSSYDALIAQAGS
ncbi:MAG: PstS family phosphate ABC transporter substrate-binding protein [Actinomycetales bacterium]|nr:PstS family phosphate ABC transporter substrate-binding protein [Actinomycetales bacterium]